MKTRNKNNTHPTTSSWKIILLKNISFLFIAISLTITLLFYSVYIGLWGTLPSDDELLAIQHHEASLIYSDDNHLIGKYFLENRININYKNIAPIAIDALIATEDARFYQHEGIDKISLLRVFFKTLLLGDRSSGGGSTISQQLAKNLYPRDHYKIRLMPIIKIKEMIIATRLEDLYTKQEILTLYLNTVTFGENIHGIESAAQHYFSTSATQLSTEQAATLIGMLKAPTRYNPRLYPERSKERRNVVLNQMEKDDKLSSQATDSLKQLPLSLQYQSAAQYAGPAPYFRQHIKQDILDIIDQYNQQHGTTYNLFTDGLIITTTINSNIQNQAENAAKKHLNVLQQQLDKEWKTRKPWDDNPHILSQAIQQSQYYQTLKKQGLSEKEIQTRLNQKKEMLIYTAFDTERLVYCSSIDSIKHYLMLLQPACVALNARDGAIQAWVGGANFKYMQYDQVNAQRQVGSVFKPIVYSAAIHHGAQLQAFYPNRQTTYHEFDNWTPRNSDNHYEGFYTLKGALSKSINTIAVEVLMQTGIDKTITHARQLGISSALPAYPSLALGVANLSLLEMMTPYLCFAGNGYTRLPYAIKEIKTKTGAIIYQHASSVPKQVLTSEECAIMNDMLMATVQQGTASRLQTQYHLPTAIAAKTGTTQNQADGWFIGYTPHIVIGIRVGANHPAIHFKSLRYGQGANMALPIYGLIMQNLIQTSDFAHWKNSTFPLYVPRQTNEPVPMYKESLNFKERLTNKKIRRRDDYSQEGGSETKKGFFKKIGNLFKKKNKQKNNPN